MTYFRKNIEEAQGYVPGEQPTGGSFIKLNQNENPYPPSPKVLEAIRAEAGDALKRYGDSTADPVRRVVAKLFNVKMHNVICGNGSDDLLTIAVRAFVDQGQSLAMSDPTYSLYEILAQLEGATAVKFPCHEDFTLPVDELAACRAPLVIACNPNAPTGLFTPIDELQRIARGIPGVLLIDEAYADFAADDAMRLARSEPNVLVMRTLSKSYSLAGLRFGFMVGSAELIEGLLKVKDSYNCDRLSIAAARAALEDQAYMHRNLAKIRGERARLTAGLRKLNFTVLESQSNFVFARPPQGQARELQIKLKERGVLIRYFNKPRTREYVRITVGTPEEMTILLGEVENLLA